MLARRSLSKTRWPHAANADCFIYRAKNGGATSSYKEPLPLFSMYNGILSQRFPITVPLSRNVCKGNEGKKVETCIDSLNSSARLADDCPPATPTFKATNCHVKK